MRGERAVSDRHHPAASSARSTVSRRTQSHRQRHHKMFCWIPASSLSPSRRRTGSPAERKLRPAQQQAQARTRPTRLGSRHRRIVAPAAAFRSAAWQLLPARSSHDADAEGWCFRVHGVERSLPPRAYGAGAGTGATIVETSSIAEWATLPAACRLIAIQTAVSVYRWMGGACGQIWQVHSSDSAREGGRIRRAVGLPSVIGATIGA
jgi:hypothetical protein